MKVLRGAVTLAAIGCIFTVTATSVAHRGQQTVSERRPAGTAVNRNAPVEPAPLRIQRLDPASVLVPSADGRLEINGQIQISARVLDTMSNKDLADLIAVTKGLEALGGDSNRLGGELRKKFLQFTRGRIRFHAHDQLATRFLQEIKLSTNPLFANMSEWERMRVFDLAAEQSPFAAPNTNLALELKQRFAEYALFRAPNSVREFVANYQFARAQYCRQIEALRSAQNAQADVKTDAFFATTGALQANALASTRPEHVAKVAIDLGPGGLSDANDDHVLQQLRVLNLSFNDAESLVYHVHKHHPELPPAQRANAGGFEADAYLHSAWTTLRDASSTAIAHWSQDGQSRRYILRNSQTVFGKTYKPMVVVRVSSNGEATIATYIPDAAIVQLPYGKKALRTTTPQRVKFVQRPTVRRKAPAKRHGRSVARRNPQAKRHVRRRVVRKHHAAPIKVQTTSPNVRILAKGRAHGGRISVLLSSDRPVAVSVKVVKLRPAKGRAVRRKGRAAHRQQLVAVRGSTRTLIQGNVLPEGKTKLRLPRLARGTYRIEIIAQGANKKRSKISFRSVVR